MKLGREDEAHAEEDETRELPGRGGQAVRCHELTGDIHPLNLSCRLVRLSCIRTSLRRENAHNQAFHRDRVKSPGPGGRRVAGKTF